MNVRLAAIAGVLAIVFGPVGKETAAAAGKKYSCESCTAEGVKSTASTALGPVTKSTDCKLRKGSGNLPVQDPACTPGAFNPTVTADILRSGRFRTGCVRNCVTTQAQKQIVYERYGVHKDRATCELDHLVPLELGGADTLDNSGRSAGRSAQRD